jgi:hypothetical protein
VLEHQVTTQTCPHAGDRVVNSVESANNYGAHGAPAHT